MSVSIQRSRSSSYSQGSMYALLPPPTDSNSPDTANVEPVPPPGPPPPVQIQPTLPPPQALLVPQPNKLVKSASTGTLPPPLPPPMQQPPEETSAEPKSKFKPPPGAFVMGMPVPEVKQGPPPLPEVRQGPPPLPEIRQGPPPLPELVKPVPPPPPEPVRQGPPPLPEPVKQGPPPLPEFKYDPPAMSINVSQDSVLDSKEASTPTAPSFHSTTDMESFFTRAPPPPPPGSPGVPRRESLIASMSSKKLPPPLPTSLLTPKQSTAPVPPPPEVTESPGTSPVKEKEPEIKYQKPKVTIPFNPIIEKEDKRVYVDMLSLRNQLFRLRESGYKISVPLPIKTPKEVSAKSNKEKKDVFTFGSPSQPTGPKSFFSSPISQGGAGSTGSVYDKNGVLSPRFTTNSENQPVGGIDVEKVKRALLKKKNQ